MVVRYTRNNRISESRDRIITVNAWVEYSFAKALAVYSLYIHLELGAGDTQFDSPAP